MSLASQISAGFAAVGNYIRDSILPRLVPTGGVTGHVLTKQASGYDWAAGVVGGLTGSSVLTIPDGAGRLDWSEDLTIAGLSPGDKVLVALAPGEDDDENTLDMLDLVALGGAVNTADTLSVSVSFSAPTSGPINILWKVL